MPVSDDPTPADVERARNRLLARIEATPTAKTRSRRRRLWVGGVLGSVSLATAGAVAAAGLIPSGVVHRFGTVDTSNTALRPVLDLARLRVRATTPGGDAFELWQAPSSGGGLCEYVRIITASGQEDGGVSCSANAGVLGTVPELYAQSTPMRPAPFTAVYGRAPAGATTVELDFSNHVRLRPDVIDGWFAITVPFGLDEGADRVAIESVTAFDAAGTVLARSAR